MAWKNVHTVFNNGLVGWWPLNGNSNDLVNGANGVDYSVSYVAGKLGQAAQYTSSESRTIVSNLTGLNTISSEITVACWAKMNTTSNKVLLVKYNASYNGDWFYTVNSGKFLFRTYGGTWGVSAIDSFSTGQWYFLCATLKSGVLSLYINGEFQGSQNSVANIESTNNPLEIGNYFIIGGDSINGLLDDLRVYNRGLSEYEIKRLYANGRGLKLAA